MIKFKPNLLNWLTGGIALLAISWPLRAVVVNFSDLTLAPQSYYNGADMKGGFTSGGAFFINAYNATYGSWDGFSYANVTDTATPGYGNQYASFAGGGSAMNGIAVPGDIYAVGYDSGFDPCYISLPSELSTPLSVRVTNTTYAALIMRDGDPLGFAKKFGGATGNDPDWFKLTFTGWSHGAVTGTVTFMLADFTFADNSKDYIVNTWQQVDLRPLGIDVDKIQCAIQSSDTGIYGINTPAYFALDNLVGVPEPSTPALLLLGAAAAAIYLRRRGVVDEKRN